jgi:subfamily B ATP-binding cassette protein MsbA
MLLNNIDLDIKAGDTVAIVGSTGSGKTTIIQLLTRFYSPNSGSITIDGIDINQFELTSLRAQIAFVDQNVRLFNDSIKGNIALGQINTMTNEKIENATKIANAYEFITFYISKTNLFKLNGTFGVTKLFFSCVLFYFFIH